MRAQQRTIVTICLAAAASAAAGDVVVLTSGTVYEGTLKRFDLDELELTVESGRMFLERDKIASIHFGITAEEYRQRREPAPAPAPAPGVPAVGDDGVVEWGEVFRGELLELSIKDARIDRPTLRNVFGDEVSAPDEQLMVTLRIVNRDDRRSFQYSPPAIFQAGWYALRDDTGTRIRGVEYGLGTTVVGALTDVTPFPPGRKAAHLEVFAIPHPRTEYLILSVDLRAFGSGGAARFRIPATQIHDAPG